MRKINKILHQDIDNFTKVKLWLESFFERPHLFDESLRINRQMAKEMYDAINAIFYYIAYNNLYSLTTNKPEYIYVLDEKEVDKLKNDNDNTISVEIKVNGKTIHIGE